MLSLSRRLSEPERCAIHVLVSPADLPHAHRLLECFREQLAGKVSTVPKVMLHELRTNRLPYLNIYDRLNTCKDQAMARIYLSQYLPDVERVLYLDFDTIIKDDVGPLYRMPMEHSTAAVVQSGERPSHLYSKKHTELRRFFERDDEMINSGVLVMDLQRWRSEEITEALEDLIAKTQVHEDQFLLNLAFNPNSGGRPFDRLDPAWNTCQLGGGAMLSGKVLQRAKILHWSSMWKPWTQKYGKNHNYRSLWEEPKRCAVAEEFLHVSW